VPAARTEPTWWIYVVRRADGALYTGIATDVARRFAAHCAGKGAKALRGRGPLALVFRRRLGTVGRALRIERAFKRLPKETKERLVQQPRGWPSWLRSQAPERPRAGSA
jgi:putative endonuclease